MAAFTGVVRVPFPCSTFVQFDVAASLLRYIRGASRHPMAG